MYDFLKEVRAIGFDLDQTLYPDSPEINNRVRNKIAERLVNISPSFRTSYESMERARKRFEERYKILKSGTEVLREAGYANPERVMDDCLAGADVLDLISENPKLKEIFDKLENKYKTLFLITSSPKDLANEKLKKIGISPAIFKYKIYSDTPNTGPKSTGEPFRFILNLSSLHPSQHLYIGDRLKSDILPPKNLGMYAGGVWSEIKEADFSIPHINKLEDVLL